MVMINSLSYLSNSTIQSFCRLCPARVSSHYHLERQSCPTSPQAVGVVGFKAAGVAAGTMAAGWQASIGKD